MNLDGWGTWSAERPVELVHLPSGLTITPVLYSARVGKVSLIGMGPDLTLGERALDGSALAFRASHGGTTLDFAYRFGADGGVSLEWTTIANGEWGLRFWVALCVHGPEAALTYDRDHGALLAVADGTAFTISAAKKPLLVTVHDDLSALAEEYEEKGYFYLASRGNAGHCLALRFNLEEAPAMRVSVVPDGAVGGRPSLPDAPVDIVPPRAEEAADRPLRAVHDVMAWNHVYDRINARPYTVLTRYWNAQKFGGFGIWLNDVVFNAWMWGFTDLQRARENLEAVFAWQTEAGNFPCLVTGNDQWLDRSQPPILSFVVWSLAARHGDRSLLEWAYPGLLRNHDWWWRRRSVGEARLVVYGTSLDAGDGLYKGTKLAAKDESSMDNMAVHDPAPFDDATGLLMSYDVALNSLLALDGECLSLMAEALGYAEDAERLRQSSAAHRAEIGTHLWDASRGVFANRLVGGGFVEPLAPTSFFPMVAGAASAEQVESLVANYLTPREKFGGWPGLPSATRDHPAYQDNVYWRGRIWGPLNFWTFAGLARAGRHEKARALAAASWRLFDTCGWRDRLCGENYNGETGAILDQSDTDAFYSWGALLPAMAVSSAIDVTPWAGLSVGRPLGSGPLGPVSTPIGAVEVEARGETLSVGCAGSVLVQTSLPRLERISLAGDVMRFEVGEGPVGEWIASPLRPIARATLGGIPLEVAPGGRITLPARSEPALLELHRG